MRGSCQFWERWNRLFFFFFLGQLSQIFSRTEVLSHWEGCQISLLFSLGENSSGPWAISAQFCGFSFQSIHTCLCITSPSLLDCYLRCWWRGRGGRTGGHCTGWREQAGDGHQLWQVALPALPQSDGLSFPSNSATVPTEAGKSLLLLISSPLPK